MSSLPDAPTTAEPPEVEPEDVIPDWYLPYKIPKEFSESLQPLVYLAGLDVEKNLVHRGILEILRMRSNTRDFNPYCASVPLSHKFPVKKSKNDQLEAYVPPGILRNDWLKKHLEAVPSVVVTFFDMNWTDPYWNDKKNECAKRVRELKADLAPHGSQILVMLIKTADAGEDNFSTDRASALCAAADIPPKALYILSHTHSERIQACVQRLEIGIKEASKVYYLGRIRRVKNWKDRTQDPAMLTRYNFKTGVFQEIRRDYVSALSHYQAAHELLRTMRVTESNVQQIRCVSSLINFRICRLNLLKMDYTECVNQFEKHIRAFKNTEGNKELIFEHLAWLQTQYSMFADLLRGYYRPGITTLDPVTYFLSAVNFTEKRVTHCRTYLLNAEITWPEEMDAYRKDCPVEYFGQRPWRQDGFGPDTVFVPEDANAIQALKYFELKYKHSRDKINDLGVASDFCRDQQRLRTRIQLMMMMGVEFFTSGEYNRAIMLMTHVLREFGRGKGPVLFMIADCGLRAAYCDGDISAYLSFLVFTLKRDLEIVTSKRQEMLWSNLITVLDKQIPPAEPACVPNEEKWQESFKTPFVSYVPVHLECIVDAVFYFNSETFRASSTAEVKVTLKNRAEFPIRISKFGVAISIPEYNCENQEEVVLSPGETKELSVFFTPTLKDVGKIIQIHMGYIDIGKPDSSVILHYPAVMGVSPYLWNDGKKEKKKQIIAKIEPMVPLLRPKITRDDPMLVNEWHKVLVSWTNTDTHAYTKVHVNILVATSDPSDIILATDPHQPGKYGSLSHNIEMEQLEPDASIDSVVFMKCAKPKASEIQILTKVKYLDHTPQAVTNELMEPVELVKPFEITQKFCNLQTDDINSVLVDEKFALCTTLKNATKTTLSVLSAKLSNMVRGIELADKTLMEMQNETLREGEVVQMVNTLLSTGSVETGQALGFLEICWKRESEVAVPPCTTVIGISPILVNTTGAIYVEGIFSATGAGKLKKPMSIKYVISNRSYKTYDLWISLESSECFMNAGPKKINAKITARQFKEMNFILFPLKTGLLKTPEPVIDFAKSSGAGDNHPQPSIVHKNVIHYIFVSRGENEGTKEGTPPLTSV